MTTLKINFSIAAAAIASPAWLQLLVSVSPLLTVVLQVLGITLAVMQMIKLIRDWNKL